MYPAQYNQKYNRLKEKAADVVTNIMSNYKLRQFYFTLANIKTLLPHILKGRSYKDLFTELLYTRALTPLDASNYAQHIEEVKLKGAYQSVLYHKETPLIFCTYHLGSYRAIIGLLARLGYDFSLVIDQQVFDTQEPAIRQVVKTVNEHFNTHSDFDLINAEEFNAAMKMIKQLKQGRALVLYIDGNTGTGGVFRHDEKLGIVNFFGKRLFARQGIAYLSFLSNIPIVPVISYREGLENSDSISIKNIVLEFFEKIDPSSSRSKKIYCTETTQHLYDLLEQRLEEYPLQWEGWFYVHKYFDEQALPSSNAKPKTNEQKKDRSQLVFNEERFGLFTFGQQYFLFNNETYQTFVISETEFSFLTSFLDRGKPLTDARELVSGVPLEKLLDLGILVAQTTHQRY